MHFDDGSTAIGAIKIAGAFAAPGDSGSAVVKTDGYQVCGVRSAHVVRSLALALQSMLNAGCCMRDS